MPDNAGPLNFHSPTQKRAGLDTGWPSPCRAYMAVARSRSECASISAAASVLAPGLTPGRLSRLSLAPTANPQRVCWWPALIPAFPAFSVQALQRPAYRLSETLIACARISLRIHQHGMPLQYWVATQWGIFALTPQSSTNTLTLSYSSIPCSPCSHPARGLGVATRRS